MSNFCRIYWAMLMLAVSPLAAAFPLSTEDTGTLGQGRSKVELTGEWGEERGGGSREVSVTQEISMIHGLLDHLNGFFALPYRDVRTHTAASRTHVGGVGDAKFGMKWRFFERGGLSFGVKAVITAPSGDEVEKLGNGKSTQAINAIASYATGSWKFNFDLGYKRNRNTLSQRERLGSISAAAVRSLDSRWKVMADIGVASNKSERSNQAPAYLGAGLSFAMTKDMSLDVGVKHGLTSVETDFTGLVGLNLRL